MHCCNAIKTLIQAPFMTILKAGKAGVVGMSESAFAPAEFQKEKDPAMTTHPLIDRQLGQYTERLIAKTEDLWRLEHAARELRAREIARLFRAARTWVKTYLVEPVASALRAERAYRELMALDDRTLADIGIARSEISGIVARSIAPHAAPRRTVSMKAVATVQPQAEVEQKRVA